MPRLVAARAGPDILDAVWVGPKRNLGSKQFSKFQELFALEGSNRQPHPDP
jgi:hypothetical protein